MMDAHSLTPATKSRPAPTTLQRLDRWRAVIARAKADHKWGSRPLPLTRSLATSRVDGEERTQ